MNQLSEFLLIFFVGVIITVTPYTGSAFAFHGTPPTVMVTVERVILNQMNAAPMYAQASIEGTTFKGPVVTGQDISPNWEFSKPLSFDFGNFAITLAIKEEGVIVPPTDQGFDLNPGPGIGLLLDVTYDNFHDSTPQESCKISVSNVIGIFGGPCGTTITLQGEDSPAAQISFRVDLVEPTTASGLQVNCIHDPIWPNVQANVNIRARALDESLAPKTVDSIEIWVNSQSGPVRIGSSVTELLHTVGPFSSSFSYNCRVIDDGQTISTQWRRVFVGPQAQGGAVPVLYTGNRNSSIDIVFIPHTDSYISAVTPNFENDVLRAIQTYYNEPIFLRNQDRINFWMAQDTGDGTGYITTGTSRVCILTPPINWDTDYTFAQAGAILHREGTMRDCAPGGQDYFSAMALPLTSPVLDRVIVHETGHQPFGLADEYCNLRAGSFSTTCDGGYFEPPIHPNLFEELEDCQNDPLSVTCDSFTDPLTSEDWHTSDPVTNDLMVDNRQPQRLDSRMINWWFRDVCAAAGC